MVWDVGGEKALPDVRCEWDKNAREIRGYYEIVSFMAVKWFGGISRIVHEE